MTRSVLAVLPRREKAWSVTADTGMSWEIAFGGDVEDVLVTAHGRASVDGLHAMTAEWIADPRFARGSAILLDYRDLDWGAMSSGDLRSRAKAVTEYRETAGDARVAFVTRGTLERGLIRMVEAYADEVGGIWFDWITVSTLEAARDWLRK